LHHAPAHANPQSRCDGLSKADAKRGQVQKGGRFAGETGKKYIS
jgi:hypothetical protein